MGDISDIVPRYLNVETLLSFLADRGDTAVEEWRHIISTGEINETQIKELQDAIKVFMADATSKIVHAVDKKCQRMRRLRRARSPQREISDHRTLEFTYLTQLDICKNSQESSASSLEVKLIMDQFNFNFRLLETAIIIFRIALCVACLRLRRDGC